MKVENKQNLLPAYMYPRTSWIYALVVFLSFIIVLTLLSLNRYHTFREDINQLMDVSAIAAAREIEATIREMQRDVAIFTAEQAEHLAKINRDKDPNSRKFIRMSNLLEKRVPNMFTYTISNEDSSNLLDDFNHNVGTICRIDIQNFVLNSFKQNVRIHPHPSGYHFDIMTPFVGFNNEILVFFVSFLPHEINRILNNYTNQNFELVVSSTLHQGLIEVTKDGTRANIKDSFYLTEKEVHSSFPIANTHWEVTVVTMKGLYSTYIKNIIYEALALLMLFVTICAPIFMLSRQQFKKRQAAVLALKESEISFFDLYEYAPDIYMTINRKGKILSANKHAREFFRLKNIQETKETITNLVHTDDTNRITNHIKNIYTCKTLESELELIRNEKLGKLRNIHARFRLTPSIPNSDRNLRVVCRDITDQKQASRIKLEHAQTQRDALVSEVHHRIKNNLQNVISILKTYTRKNPEIELAVKEVSSKIGSISEAYGLQGRANSSVVYVSDLTTAIVENERKLFLSHINLNIEQQLKNDGNLVEREITPIAVIISELITNAIKHGKKTGAAVANVNVKKEMNGVSIEISNTINPKGADIEKTNPLTSGQGQGLIQSLLPPNGAYLKFKKSNNVVKATLYLESPDVIFIKEINQRIFAI